MLVQCTNCGAPLDVSASKQYVKCRYCGASTELKTTQTLAAETPAGWKPPQQWTPPPEAPAPSRPLKYRNPFRFVPALVVLAVATGGVGGFSNLRHAIAGMVSSSNIPVFSNILGWDGASTWHCPVNGELEVEDKTLTFVDGVVAVDAAAPNCRITFRRTTFNGPVLVRGAVNADITLEDCTVTATDVGVDTGMNAHVVLRRTTIDAPIAVRGDMNLRLEAESATLAGRGAALIAGANSTVQFRDSEVRGDKTSLDIGPNSQLQLANTTVIGKRRLGRNVVTSE